MRRLYVGPLWPPYYFIVLLHFEDIVLLRHGEGHGTPFHSLGFWFLVLFFSCIIFLFRKKKLQEPSLALGQGKSKV